MKQITFTIFLSILSSEEQSNFISEISRSRYMIDTNVDNVRNSYSDFLSRAFSWHNSIMGEEYWVRIFNRLLEIDILTQKH